ncbi:TetR/AcrR family transcriptional regulator [Vibrio sp. SM6]|uniref:TetR/AcrR family transcriptional regulator n=1 Tax=Vibrio agarilyticus TaxID=2726741 RepID=A0A7X8TPH3_9VIBR|nr:TetR/AcrR family transcriptional regulator [Vibrio agarilyticus]
MKVSEKKRLDLLAAAKQEFITHGYHAANMDRVCEIAGTSKRTLYRHFAAKETLFIEAINHIFDGLRQQVVLNYEAAASLESQLCGYFLAKSAALYEDVGLPPVRMIIGEFIRQPSLAQQYVQFVQDRDNDLQAWLENAITDGRLGGADAEQMSAMLLALYHGSFLWPQLIANAPILPVEQQRMRLEQIVLFFVRGFTPVRD